MSGYVDTGRPTDVDVIFLDFAKAFEFDKVLHQRLIGKVQNHGIDGKVLNWISNWLSGRVKEFKSKELAQHGKWLLEECLKVQVLGLFCSSFTLMIWTMR